MACGLRIKSLLYILNDDFTGNLGGLFGQLISGDNLVVPSGYDIHSSPWFFDGP